jgi:AcrR family transcriptional regulator
MDVQTAQVARPDGVYAPKQARSERTHAAILEAARELIAEGGLESLTIADLASRTGLTKGAFYARFRDKDALLDALHREAMAENRAELDSFLEAMQRRDASLAQMVREAVPIVLRLSRQRWALLRVLGLESRGGERTRKRIAEAIEDLARPLQDLFRERREELCHPDPETAAGMFVVLLFGFVDWAFLARESPAPVVPESDEQLAEEMVRVLTGYLGLEGR